MEKKKQEIQEKDIENVLETNTQDNVPESKEPKADNPPKEENITKPKYVVSKAFKDAPEYRIEGKVNSYELESDVSDLDPKRLESLEKRGLVKKEE